ncbi:hypothetical protein evm_014120 [Chilo suppressalis]|nr:hypothetical protein evm_014120 [Chilo suppressalis]
MFRMTWIHPEDRRYQLILWRSDPSQELKELFMDGLHWDEAVSEAIVNKWLDMIEDLFHLEILKIPRCIALPDAVSYSLHGFGDASEATQLRRRRAAYPRGMYLSP